MKVGNQTYEVATELYKLADKAGINVALEFAFGENVAMSLSIPRELADLELGRFDMPTRVVNILNKWCGIYSDKPRTVDRMIGLIAMGDYAKEFITRYGKKAQNYMKTFLLVESYERYTDEQKFAFCYKCVELNCKEDKARG